MTFVGFAKMTGGLALVAGLLSAGVSVRAQTRMANQDALRMALGADAYDYDRTYLPQVKVAILDNGFAGYESGRDLLPDSTELIAPPLAIPSPDSHGLGMAQILWGITGRPKEGPKFYLLNTQGFTRFKNAIDFVVNQHIDVVVYAQNWFFGSNFDGKGFLNAEVNRATNAGAIWINSAGNLHNLVYAQDVLPENSATNFLKLPGPYDTLQFENALDSNTINITLSWNDFTDSSEYNTNKDLDIFLYNAQGTAIAFPNKIQKGEAPSNRPDDQRSSHARESATLTLDAGVYSIKIKDQSGNFVSSDKMRLVLFSEKANSLRFKNGTGSGSAVEVLPPADNASVITVGDCSGLSSANSSSGSMWTPTVQKPDVVLDDTLVRFTDGSQSFGSSNAAALLGGVLSLMKAHNNALSTNSLKDFISSYLPTETSNRYGEDCREQRIWRTPLPSVLDQIVSRPN